MLLTMYSKMDDVLLPPPVTRQQHRPSSTLRHPHHRNVMSARLIRSTPSTPTLSPSPSSSKLTEAVFKPSPFRSSLPPKEPPVSERVDLSRRGLSKCPAIIHPTSVFLLNLEHNLIRSADGLTSFNNLVVLSLYDNQIEKMKGLEGLTNVKLLLLGKNRLTSLDVVDKLLSLQVLDVHSNQITQITALSQHPKLRVVNLAGNRLVNCAGIDGLVSLVELNIRRNKLKSLVGLETMPALQRLYLSHNTIKDLEDVQALREFHNLREVTLNDNPISQKPLYIALLCNAVRNLQLLDGSNIATEKKEELLQQLQNSRDPEFKDLRKAGSSGGRAAAQQQQQEAHLGKEAAIDNAKKRWELLKSEAIKITKQIRSERGGGLNDGANATSTTAVVSGGGSGAIQKVRASNLGPRPRTAIPTGGGASKHNPRKIVSQSVSKMNNKLNSGQSPSKKDPARMHAMPYKIDLSLNLLNQHQHNNSNYLSPMNSIVFPHASSFNKKQIPAPFRPLDFKFNDTSAKPSSSESSVFSMLRLLSNSAISSKKTSRISSASAKNCSGRSGRLITTTDTSESDDDSSSSSESENSDSQATSDSAPQPQQQPQQTVLTVPDLPPVPTCKQGPDFVIEIEEDTLSIFGQDALRLMNFKWSPEQCAKITHARFRFVHFDDLVPLFEGEATGTGLRHKFPNLRDFTFQDTCLDRLAQLNGLAVFPTLETLSVLSDGNQIVQHPQWRLYAVFRLGNRGLKTINGLSLSEEEIKEAPELFGPLSRLTFSCQNKERILQLYCFLTSSSSSNQATRALMEESQDPLLLQEAIGREALTYHPLNRTSTESALLRRARATNYIQALSDKYLSFARKLRLLDAIQEDLTREMVRKAAYNRAEFQKEAKAMLKDLSDSIGSKDKKEV